MQWVAMIVLIQKFRLQLLHQSMFAEDILLVGDEQVLSEKLALIPGDHLAGKNCSCT
jgi:hypothetical protein